MARTLNVSYDDLIEKSQRIFWLKGYKGISVSELSDYLGVSQSVLYNKYSKELLFNASLDYYTNTYSDPFLSQLRASTGGLESLKLFFYDLYCSIYSIFHFQFLQEKMLLSSHKIFSH